MPPLSAWMIFHRNTCEKPLAKSRCLKLGENMKSIEKYWKVASWKSWKTLLNIATEGQKKGPSPLLFTGNTRSSKAHLTFQAATLQNATLTFRNVKSAPKQALCEWGTAFGKVSLTWVHLRIRSQTDRSSDYIHAIDFERFRWFQKWFSWFAWLQVTSGYPRHFSDISSRRFTASFHLRPWPTAPWRWKGKTW